MELRIALSIVIFVFGIILVLNVKHLDANPRVDKSEWRVRPSKSGKTWEAYRYTSGGMYEYKNRFTSPEAAEKWVRDYKLKP